VECFSGQPAAARARLDQLPFASQPETLENDFILLHQLAAQTEAELALAAGQPQSALAQMDSLIAHYHRSGLQMFITDALLMRGRALAAAGRPSEAEAALEAARAKAEQLGSLRIFWQIQAELAALARTRGDEAAARALSQQAAELIEYIAARAGEPELRESFL